MRRLTVLIAALALLALAPALARADGDPASDVLLLQNSYLPYAPPVSKGVGNALNNVLNQTKAKGYGLKVAVISSPQDLGSVPQLLGQPQNYALFLEREIAFNSKKPLLVVMQSGYGLAAQPAGVTGAALKGVAKPSSSKPDDLARSAIDASVALSKAAGHPVAKPSVPGGGGSSSSTSPLLIFGVPVLLLVIAGLLATTRRRDSDEEDEPVREDEPART